MIANLKSINFIKTPNACGLEAKATIIKLYLLSTVGPHRNFVILKSYQILKDITRAHIKPICHGGYRMVGKLPMKLECPCHREFKTNQGDLGRPEMAPILPIPLLGMDRKLDRKPS